MARTQGKPNSKGNKRPALPTFFYLNDQLHKKLSINRGKDMLTTWNFLESKKVIYNYSDTLRRYEKCFNTDEVAEMMHRRRLVIDIAWRDGMIEKPQRTYSLDEKRKPLYYKWSEKDIMGLLDYLSTVHRGRPRRDGQVTPAYLPTPREVRAMIHDDGSEVLYVQQGDQFVPTWRAKEF